MTALKALAITGASTGIGYAAAAWAVGHGARVYAGVRTRADARRLEEAFKDRVHPLLMDVTDEAACAAAAAEIAKAQNGARLLGLVNNAGVSVPGPLLHLSTADLRRQIDVNLLGVHTVTRAFAPLLGAADAQTCTIGPPGRIVMISSVSGRRGAPFLGAYAASKFALEGYSETLRRELMPFGVDVVVIGPGPIRTPIWDKGLTLERARYAGTVYAEGVERLAKEVARMEAAALPPDRVAALIWRALTAPAPKTRYALTPAPLETFIASLLPARTLDRIMARRLALLPRRARERAFKQAGDRPSVRPSAKAER